jgi:flagellar basal-body rod protein FlgG
MINSLWISKTGMEAQQTQLDTDLAQPGQRLHQRLQARHAVFEDLMYQNLRQAGANSTEQTQLPTGLQLGLGVRTVATARSSRRATCSRPQQRWTWPSRATASSRSRCPTAPPATPATAQLPGRRQGQLVTSNGYAVSPASPSRQCAEHHRGRRRRSRPRSPAARPRRRSARSELANFINPAGLEPEGPEPVRRNRRVGRAAGPDRQRPAPTAWARSSRAMWRPPTSTWSRNWSPMIQTQRAYEMNSKAIQTSDQMLPDAQGIGWLSRFFLNLLPI